MVSFGAGPLLRCAILCCVSVVFLDGCVAHEYRPIGRCPASIHTTHGTDSCRISVFCMYLHEKNMSTLINLLLLVVPTKKSPGARLQSRALVSHERGGHLSHFWCRGDLPDQTAASLFLASPSQRAAFYFLKVERTHPSWPDLFARLLLSASSVARRDCCCTIFLYRGAWARGPRLHSSSPERGKRPHARIKQQNSTDRRISANGVVCGVSRADATAAHLCWVGVIYCFHRLDPCRSLLTFCN